MTSLAKRPGVSATLASSSWSSIVLEKPKRFEAEMLPGEGVFTRAEDAAVVPDGMRDDLPGVENPGDKLGKDPRDKSWRVN